MNLQFSDGRHAEADELSIDDLLDEASASELREPPKTRYRDDEHTEELLPPEVLFPSGAEDGD